MSELEEASQLQARQWSASTAREMLHELTLLAWMSLCRSQDGEYLHAQQHLGAAVDVLLRMLKRYAASDGFSRISESAPRRRLHSIAPDLARELLGVLLGTVEIPGVRLLEIAEQYLRPRIPEREWQQVLEVRARMQRDRPTKGRLEPAGGEAAPVYCDA
jgi:hypothetical protein